MFMVMKYPFSFFVVVVVALPAHVVAFLLMDEYIFEDVAFIYLCFRVNDIKCALQPPRSQRLKK